MGYTVGELAKLAHVSVRALHHYDEIGLLEPSGRTRSGYRVYTERDLARLQQVLFFRELGFTLDDIGRILRDPTFDRRKALVAQRELLVQKANRLRGVIALVDRTIEALERGTTMKDDEMFTGLGDFDPAAHDGEAKQRWGDTPEYAESKRRTKRYTKEDWQTIRAEGDAIEAAFADALAAGVAPTDARAIAIAERARLHVDRWFYPCSRALHASLGEMYVSDPRFTEHYEKRRAGLAQFVCDAIRANRDAAAAAP